MTFEEFIKTTSFPEMAKKHLPNALSEMTKKELLKRDDAEVVLREAIADVDLGSKRSLESIVKEKLK